MIAAATATVANSNVGICGIANNHAYSILAAFNLTASNGTIIQALMVRNPWGSCNTHYCYNGSLNSNDIFWTSSTKS